MHKLLSIQFVSILFFSMFQSLPHRQINTSNLFTSGVDVTYEITVDAPPNEGIKIKATYSGITSPLRLQISYENWAEITLDILKDIQFTSLDGKKLEWTSLNSQTIEVMATENTIIANYEMDLPKMNTTRGTKVSSIGGVLSGYQAFLLPDLQKINSIKVKFVLPSPWKVVSFFPTKGDWFEVKPFTYADLLLEAKTADWYFGIIDFDQTKTYEDGFKIRVVGFKNFSYEHWDVYMGDTPLDEAFKSADFYHATYLKIKEIFGEYPYTNILLIGPGYWQTRSTYMRQQMVGWYRYEYIPHHMIHTFFGINVGSRLGYSGRFNLLLDEGYTTYSEGIMSADIAGEPYWRGMVYERKFHYLRGLKFDHINDTSNQDYVLGFIVTYLMDQEIRSETNGQKGIDDLMAKLWQKYSTPNYSRMTDEQILDTLKELTGNDWHGFYNQNVVDINHLNVDKLDDMKGDFKTFLKVVSDTWYNGYPSMYFISQEIVSAGGNFDMGVRLQSQNVMQFSIAALQRIDINHADLTEADVEEILNQITGKDHSDFFEFYRNQGFEVDLKEINEYVRTYTFRTDGADNAIKLIPNTFPLGKSTLVVGELVDKDFASAKELLLQIQVNMLPTGLSDLEDLITGYGVWYQFFSGESYIFGLPIITIGDKTYTFFTINVPNEDAGIMQFSFWAKNDKPTSEDYLGGFIGTQKVTFQNDSTFNFKLATFNIEDDIPPLLSITTPANREVIVENSNYCIIGLKEPEASLQINGERVTIVNDSYKFNHCLDLNYGANPIKVTETDKAGNSTIMEFVVTLPLLTQQNPQSSPGSIWIDLVKPFVIPIIALVLFVGFMTLFYFKVVKQKERKRLPRLMIIIVFVGVVILVVFGVLNEKSQNLVNDRLNSTNSNDGTIVESKPDINSTKVTEIDRMTMVYVPEGKFLMGSSDGAGEINEQPQHTVNLRAFWIDQTEITNIMYRKCVDEGSCTEPSEDYYYSNEDFESYPVTSIDWNQASDYCKWAGRILPTEAQWEKAARGINGKTYPWGEEIPDSNFANFGYKGSTENTGVIGSLSPVYSFPKGQSPFNVYNMAGNASEWVADWYGDYQGNSQIDPIGPELGDYRVVRGGSTINNENYIRSAFRNKAKPTTQNSTIGFRCALPAE